MGFTSQQLWECLVNRRSENKQFAQEFNNRKAWGKHYYNLVWEGKTPNLVACYLKTESIVRISVYIVSDEIYKKVRGKLLTH